MPLDDTKDIIKQTPISSIIAHYLTLHKKGSSTLALCPFHNDRSPSLHINDERGMFKCFACQTGGDALTFVEKFKNIGFKEALIEIAGLLNLPTEHLLDGKKDPKRELALKVLNRASHLYRKYAQTGSYAPYNQFLQKRNLTAKVAEDFQLGYAPTTQSLCSYLSTVPEPERSAAQKMAIELSLIRQGRNGHYDTFRERITFPIWDQHGRVLGFGSRAVFDYQKAKYINSQESFIFNKRQILYGFHLAKQSIREKDQVLLVEGYMDLIKLHQHGFTNSVAVMGVALSEKTISFLSSYTRNFILALDSDEAGMRAMKRINQQLMEHQIIPRYLNFAPQKDPDEFLVEQGPEVLWAKIKSAPFLIGQLIQDCIPSPLPETSTQKLKVLEEVFELVAPLGDHLEATERILQATQQLELKSTPEQLIKQYQEFLTQKKPRKTEELPKSPKKITQVRAITNEHSISMPKFLKSERNFLKETLLYPEFLAHPLFLPTLDFVRHTEVKRFLNQLRKLYYEVAEEDFFSLVSDLLKKEELSRELKELVGATLFHSQSRTIEEHKVEKTLQDLKKNLSQETLIQQRDQLREQQKLSQSKEDAMNLMGEILKIERQLFQLKK